VPWRIRWIPRKSPRSSAHQGGVCVVARRVAGGTHRPKGRLGGGGVARQPVRRDERLVRHGVGRGVGREQGRGVDGAARLAQGAHRGVDHDAVGRDAQPAGALQQAHALHCTDATSRFQARFIRAHSAADLLHAGYSVVALAEHPAATEQDPQVLQEDTSGCRPQCDGGVCAPCRPGRRARRPASWRPPPPR
jgi:hypothetical protein